MAPYRNHVEARSSRKPARQYVSETHDHKPDAPTYSTSEKIETIVRCYLGGNRTTRGKFGTLVDLGDGLYRVVADGLTVIVGSPRDGRWRVSFKGLRGEDAELIVAAKFALEHGAPRNVSTIEEALRP